MNDAEGEDKFLIEDSQERRIISGNRLKSDKVEKRIGNMLTNLFKGSVNPQNSSSSPISSVSSSVGFDEEKEVHVPLPEMMTNPNYVRQRRASAVPMTSYVATTTHTQPEPLSALQPREVHMKSTSNSNRHSTQTDRNSLMSQSMNNSNNNNRESVGTHHVGSRPMSTSVSSTTSKATGDTLAQRSSRKYSTIDRRQSFFGGVITGMGNAIRRASRAQSNMGFEDDRESGRFAPLDGNRVSIRTSTRTTNTHLSLNGMSPIIGGAIGNVNANPTQDNASNPAAPTPPPVPARDPIWIEKFTIDGLPFYWNRRTKEVRFEKPEELKTDKEKGMETDDWTWVPHPTKVWQPARVIKKQKAGEVICQAVKTGDMVIIPASKMLNGKKIPLWPLKQSSLFIAEDDLVALDDPNEGLILHTLRARYKQDQIYTFVGASRTVLISLNPYKQLDIYNLDEIDAQRNRGPNKSPPPHVYAIANDALETLKFNNESAAILISGESGAGKTEATKQCLGFLAECAGSSNRVERKILLANPLLEAFGNAKTLRNNNSSRFGKWIEVRFDPVTKEISGAQITPFLLERSRLVYQQKGERNYHILYQLCASNIIRQKHLIGEPTEFRYLNQSDCFELDDVDDEMELERTIESMEELGFTKEEQEWIFKTSCCVLHLGNIDFVPKDEEKAAEQQKKEEQKRSTTAKSVLTPVNSSLNNESKNQAEDLQNKPGCVIAVTTRTAGRRFLAPKPVDPKAPIVEDEDLPIFAAPKTSTRKSYAPGTGKGSVEAAADCLGVPVEELVQVLCQRSITVRKERSVIPLSPVEARNGCDSLAMAIYGRLFSWIVERVNHSICSTINKGKFIGILDIFGFEIFEKNSFEQLCINFTNEKLQQHFNSTMFKEEEGLYTFENIRFNKVEFVDNQPVVDLVEGKPEGILLILDDECKTPGGSDERLVSKVEKAHIKHPSFALDSKATKLQKLAGFEIKHYAGTVRYEAYGFVAANTDTLYPDMYSLCSRSAEQLTRKIFPALQENERLRLKTIGAHFRGQLTQLMDILKNTESRFIRCIKPNAKQEPNNFDSQLTLEQLRYSGVFDAVQIRKRGYPFRLTHKQFACQYKCINDGYVYKKSNDDPKGLCEEIIGASPQNFRAVQIGKTRVLYRAEHHKVLLLLRNLAVEKILPWLQARFRSCLARMFYKNMQKAQRTLVDVMESEPDIIALEEAIAEVPDTLGTLGAKLFPTSRPSNVKRAKTLKEGLEKWRDLETELEALDDDSRPIKELYFDMVAALKKAEKLKEFPMSRFQERALINITEKVNTAKLEKLEQDIADAIKTHNRTEMERLLKENEKEDFAPLEVIKMELAHMKEIEDSADLAIKNVDKHMMIKVVADAATVNLTGDNITRCSQMIAMPEAEFVELELEVAKKQDDRKRVIHREIRKRDLYLDASGSKYTPLGACPILRRPEKYAAASIKSMFLGKDKIAKQMLKWQKTNLITSLIDYELLLQQTNDDTIIKGKETEKELKRLANIAFRLIRAHMGDIKDELSAADADEPARQIIFMGEDEPLMIPELFMQTIKQVTECPATSKDKGYELLGFLVIAFGLPESICNWVLMWLRQEFANDTNKLRKFTCALHVHQYGNPIELRDIPAIRQEFNSRVRSRFSVVPGQYSGPTALTKGDEDQ